jgi:hypothetical protein
VITSPKDLKYTIHDLNKLRRLAELYQTELQPVDSFNHRLDAEQVASKVWFIATLALLEKLGYSLVKEGEDGKS